ncbi:MAG: hypothetical protein ACTSP4_11610, partial [Candidatus Hodarchaeales archaeon]
LISFYLNCIILSGGGAKYGGIVEKLVEELETRYPRQRRHINIYKSDHPEFSCLRGLKQLINKKN